MYTETLNIINKLGYKATRHPKNKKGIVVHYGKTKSERIDFLQTIIAPTVRGKWKPSTNLRSSAGGVVCEDFTIITKPEKDVNGSLASLDVRSFSTLGEPCVFDYAGSAINCVHFTCPIQIVKSIQHGATECEIISSGASTFDNLLNSPATVSWSADTTAPEKNKLGVYIGEMLSGLVALSPPQQSRYHLDINIFGLQRAKSFMIPDSPSFSGVDSFVVAADDSIIPISSKFGAGAKASIFTNLIEAAHKKSLSASNLSEFVNLLHSENVKPTNSSACVYLFGIRILLGIPKHLIETPVDVYNQIRSGMIQSEAELAFKVAKARLTTLPSPLTELKLENLSFVFNMALAEFLGEERSLKQIIEILAAKKYWQLNLDKAKWTNGEIFFKTVESGDARVRLIGNKSGSADITAKQGWVNYELRMT